MLYSLKLCMYLKIKIYMYIEKYMYGYILSVLLKNLIFNTSNFFYYYF